MFASFLIGRTDINQLVKAARSKQSGINQRGTIGRTDYDHGLQFFKPVHFSQDSVDHPAGYLRFALTRAARWHQTVNLVNEHDARRNSARPAEHAGDLLLALAIPFG